MCMGTDHNCNFWDWINGNVYKELKNVIEMRRQTTDFYDNKGYAKGFVPKIYTWDTPDKESINNYEAFTVGMDSIGFRFNFNQQTRAVIKFKTFNDVIASIGGYKATVAGVFALVYVSLFSQLIKYDLLKQIREKMKNESKKVPEIDQVRENLEVTKIRQENKEFDGIIDAIDNHGDPEKVFKQMVHF